MLVILLVVLPLIGIMVPVGQVEAFSGSGSGTVGSPYVITNVTQLQEIENNLTAYYELGNDIDASATSGWNGGLGFDPVGSSGTPFIGSLDGKGFKVSGLVIVRNADSFIGLIGKQIGRAHV